MATARDLVRDGLALISVGSDGDQLSDEDMNQGLRTLNRMISTWSAELGPIFFNSFDTLPWTANQAIQTIGPGGDLNTIRPIVITSMQSQIASIDYDIEEISFKQYQGILNKNIYSDFPRVFVYNKKYPLGEIILHPVPNSAINLRISSKKALSEYALSDEVSLPEAYEEALVYNLAWRCAPLYGTQVLPAVKGVAIRAKRDLERINDDPREMWPDNMAPGIQYGYNDRRYINTN